MQKHLLKFNQDKSPKNQRLANFDSRAQSARPKHSYHDPGPANQGAMAKLRIIFGSTNIKGDKTKNPHLQEANADFLSVRDEIRTHTAERPLPPQSSVSTNSTIRA